ncbi:hypothetical protein MINS_12750 [Mycolicibacterium insubricum]|nr:hypothetical protein MINS_12750 [Mycolicibacterium insubricum]
MVLRGVGGQREAAGGDPLVSRFPGGQQHHRPEAEIGESGQLHESDVSKFRIFAASFLSVWLNTKVGAVFAPAWIPFLRPGSRRSHSHGLGSADAFR